MNDLTVQQQGTAVTVPGNGNPFEAYGNAVSQKSIVGDILKFTKFGEYVTGQDESEMPKGQRLIANMDELLTGWVRWEDNKPTDQIMGRVADGFMPQRRNELGDTDESLWEKDDDGRPRDPWQKTNYLVLKAEGEEQLYTFATSSKSGLNAIGELCKVFGRQMRQRPDEFPVVALNAGSYIHPKYKKIFVPNLDVVGWIAKADFGTMDVGSESNSEEADQPEAAPATGKSKAKASAAAQTRF